MTDPTAEGRGMADVALVGTGLLLGLALTAGWVARTAWTVAPCAAMAAVHCTASGA